MCCCTHTPLHDQSARARSPHVATFPTCTTCTGARLRPHACVGRYITEANKIWSKVHRKVKRDNVRQCFSLIFSAHGLKTLTERIARNVTKSTPKYFPLDDLWLVRFRAHRRCLIGLEYAHSLKFVYYVRQPQVLLRTMTIRRRGCRALRPRVAGRRQSDARSDA